MPEHPVQVQLRLDDQFSGRMALAAEAAHAIHVSHALAQATWEPHDWSTF